MMSDAMWKALNEQVKWEFDSSYLYLGMAAWLNSQKLPGFAHWMRYQAKEELGHAMKIYSFIEERDRRVELLPVAAPAKIWGGVQDVVEKSLAHERTVTARIDKLVELAAEEKDHAAGIFLQWFVSEQVEEEDSFRKVLDQLSFIKPDSSAMLFLDGQMAKRGSE